MWYKLGNKSNVRVEIMMRWLWLEEEEEEIEEHKKMFTNMKINYSSQAALLQVNKIDSINASLKQQQTAFWWKRN